MGDDVFVIVLVCDDDNSGGGDVVNLLLFMIMAGMWLTIIKTLVRPEYTL